MSLTRLDSHGRGLSWALATGDRLLLEWRIVQQPRTMARSCGAGGHALASRGDGGAGHVPLPAAHSQRFVHR
jgi:hypothetical protein